MSTPAVSARLLVALAGLAAGVHAGAQEASSDAYRQHLERDGLRVDVWTPPGAPLEYEIELHRLDEPAARLSGNGRGPLLASTLTDLDGDGYVEVLLLFDAPAPRDALRLYEWNDRFLEQVTTAPPPGPAAPGAVRGQYRLDGDALLWESARYARASDPQPLDRGVWAYDFAAGAWTAIELEDGRDSLISRLPFVGRKNDDAPAPQAAAAPAAESPAGAKRSLLSRLPFMGDDSDAAPEAAPTQAVPASAAGTPGAGEPPAGKKRSLLDRLPFVGDDEDDTASHEDAPQPSAPAAPPDDDAPAPSVPAADAAAPAKKRSLLDRLPFVGDDGDDESAQAGADVFDAPAPVP